MKYTKFLRKIGTAILLFSCTQVMFAQYTLRADNTKIVIGKNGQIVSVEAGGKEILTKGQNPIVTGCVAGKVVLPVAMTSQGNLLNVKMKDGGVVQLRCQSGKACGTMEVVSVPEKYAALVFGPFAVDIHDIVGDVIGVAQGEGVAFGIQALNIKTMAGVPSDYVDALKQHFDFNGRRAELSTGAIETTRLAAVDRGNTTLFQFFCRNRSQKSYREVNNLKRAMVNPVSGPDGLIKGAKIAFFGCRQSEALHRIGEIELAQGLPHPMFGNEWGKTAQAAMKSYLITDFGEDNLDFVIQKSKIAGFEYIYHPGPFKDWGHFQWEESFAKTGDEGVKAMVDRAKAQGFKLGVHTLSNFMTTNDAYVSPVPSNHLLKQGVLTLTGNLTATQNEIVIQKSDLFSVPMTLNAMQLDDELITYGTVEEQGDKMILKGCTRGAFGTKAAAHAKSASLYKLWDYPYKTLFPDIELQDSFADRLAEIFNKTGIAQTSYDGLEGCRYTGHEDYATARFVERIHQQLNHNVLNDASNLNHFTWHIHTRMNWGEPWGEAMRTGQVANRIKNQQFFRRNLFPRMLGWFLIRLADRKFECSSLEDLEWALSESAGFDAGYAMNISLNTLKKHGQIDALLSAIKNWDYLREHHVFTEAQMERLRDPKTEWHLEKTGENSFNLYPLYISKYFHCDLGELQPGQPSGSDWSWDSPYAGSFAIRLKVEGGSISNPSFRTSSGVVKFPCTVDDGRYLLFTSDGKAQVTDKNYNVISVVKAQGNAALPQGNSAVSFSCDKVESDTPLVTVRYITRGNPERVQLTDKKNE
ncbi:hypothetical protein [uncultured Prevotella sp.]|uniref:hypothetical protein n=1 Tax=uncultured Prevotella sp. TaxID=159272 RepID=UPI0025EE0BCF|nr:hypothetical protein [uncultured Prevotella sp.]